MAKSVAKTSKEKTVKPVTAETEEEVVVVAHAKHDTDETEISVEKKLVALFTLQQIDSQVDRIRIIRGELPLEVEDLEDEVSGLETRIENYVSEVQSLEQQIAEKQHSIKESQALIRRYEEQQNNVRNNREYDALTKEVEYQNLEIQLAEKRIREFNHQLMLRRDEIENADHILIDKKNDLEVKKSELSDIVTETEIEEKNLLEKSAEQRKYIEDRLVTAYSRIRTNARNGLAVVSVERDACGGCFNSIPPQRQLDIRLHKKIIVCEFCGRILVDKELASNVSI